MIGLRALFFHFYTIKPHIRRSDFFFRQISEIPKFFSEIFLNGCVARRWRGGRHHRWQPLPSGRHRGCGNGRRFDR